MPNPSPITVDLDDLRLALRRGALPGESPSTITEARGRILERIRAVDASPCTLATVNRSDIAKLRTSLDGIPGGHGSPNVAGPPSLDTMALDGRLPDYFAAMVAGLDRDLVHRGNERGEELTALKRDLAAVGRLAALIAGEASA